MQIRRATCVGLFVLAACHDAPLTPAATHRPTGQGQTPLGLIEVTISGLRTATPSATVRSLGRYGASNIRADFSSPDSGTGTGGIQIAPLSTGTFTVGTRGAGGMRYFYATYQVRNANQFGTAYTTPRTNLTFLAVETNSSIGGTAISQLFRFDGSLANASIAAQVTPTGMVHQNGGTGFVSSKPDVLQALSESDVAAIAASPGVTTIFPWGFVTSNPNTANSRTLPANPAVGQFDGLVTFAFKYPLQATAADDPFTLSATFLALDDGQKRVTQSIEEQDAAGTAAFESRATALDATSVTLLAGGSYTGTASTRTICGARVAGTAAAPTAYAFGAPAKFLSLSPNPYALAGQFITTTSALSATFDSVVTNATPATFTVNGTESGRNFLGQSYTGNGTAIVSTPAGRFLPGEEVETTVAAAPGLACPNPWVGRLRVAPTASSLGGSFAAATTVTGNPGVGTIQPVLADVNGDGKPDLIVATGNANVAVFLNNGAGGFGTETDYPVTGVGQNLVVADFNGDGHPDIAVVSGSGGTTISVLLNNGDGTFGTKVDYTVGPTPTCLAATDLDGDGRLDLVVADSGNSSLAVLLGNGDGTFQPAVSRTGVLTPLSIAVADFNRDGHIDVVVAGLATESVFLGHGDGTFGAAVANVDAVTPPGVAVGDFDGDGIPDLAVACGAGTNCVKIYLGNGDGSFTFKGLVSSGSSSLSAPQAVVVGDFDGDGKLDIAVTNNGDNSVSVLLGNGDGTFGTSTNYQVGTAPVGVATGDGNGDGKLDLVAANSGDLTLSVIRRN